MWGQSTFCQVLRIIITIIIQLVAYRAVIKVFFSFQQGFLSRVTVFHLEKVNAHNCLGPAGQQEPAWKPAIDHTSQVTPC